MVAHYRIIEKIGAEGLFAKDYSPDALAAAITGASSAILSGCRTTESSFTPVWASTGAASRPSGRRKIAAGRGEMGEFLTMVKAHSQKRSVVKVS